MALRLSMFALVCTGVIVATDYSTRDAIATQQETMQQIGIGKMLPVDSYDNVLATDCHLLTSSYFR